MLYLFHVLVGSDVDGKCIQHNCCHAFHVLFHMAVLQSVSLYTNVFSFVACWMIQRLECTVEKPKVSGCVWFLCDECGPFAELCFFFCSCQVRRRLLLLLERPPTNKSKVESKDGS